MRKPLHLFTCLSLFTNQKENRGGYAGKPLGEGLRTIIGLSLSLSCFQLAGQPCPSIINCPQSTPTYCDESTNDVLLWNHAPFTHSPTIGNANLHEGAIDLNIKVKGCNGGGIVTISCLLYLDLDNDNFQETVVRSSAPPPGGMVMANNSFNPGYSGGDSVRFDKRALPDSMLYRFTLETVYYADTTTCWLRFCNDQAPFNYLPVILPEGRHRIEWRIVQDGVERFCDRNFKIKDCKNPTLGCKANAPIYLDASLSAVLPLAQAYSLLSDNITPDSQLLVGMRRVGTGSGFPWNGMGLPQDTARYTCDMNDNQYVEVWAQDKAGNLEHCTTLVLVFDTAGICPIIPPPPPPNPVTVCAVTYWNSETIRDVSFQTTWTTAANQPGAAVLPMKTNGCASLETVPPAGFFFLNADKDTFPLNGLTTYDLVLISKHILALEPFNTGWKMAAADANRSGSITTFDIVELRKLILGLSTKLPNNTPSWRFFVDSCTVSGSPFLGSCASGYTLPAMPLGAYPAQLSFKGIKVGDVNGSASSIDTLQGVAQTRGNTATLELPEHEMQAGETLDIPLRTADGGAWEGIQFSLQFDPELLDIETLVPVEALALDTENWAKPQPDVLNLSWSDALPTALMPGDELMRLRVKAHARLRLSEAIQISKNAPFQSEVYDAVSGEHGLQLVFSPKEKALDSGNAHVFAPMPNPTTGAVRLPLRLQVPESVSLELCDIAGNTLWHHITSLEVGAHFLEIPADAMLQTGVYVWRVCAGNTTQSGRLIRI